MKSLFVVLIPMLLWSCASTSLTPLGKGQGGVIEEDEKRLWLRSAEEEERLDGSGNLYQDSLLVAYVNSVVQRLRPSSPTDVLTFKARIIKNPLLNAFAYPNGVIYVHTGILSRIENEAQLAILLGHEMSHAIYRHAIKDKRSMENTSGFLSALGIAAMPFGLYGGLVSLLGSIGGVAAVTGYSRSLEAEADTSGLSMMSSAGYDITESPRLFVHLKNDLEEQGISEPFLFGSHPHLQDRIDNLSRLSTTRYTTSVGAYGRENIDSMMCQLLLDNASLDLTMGRFGPVSRAIHRVLAIDTGKTQAHYLLGEMYRQRALSHDLDTAEECYRHAISADSSYPPPQKALGLLLYKHGGKEEALQWFEHYLLVSPGADDRKYVEQYIQELRNQQ